MSCPVGDDEQQIAELLALTLDRLPLTQGFFELGELLVELGAHVRGVWPIEMHACSALAELDRSGQSRKRQGDPIKRALLARLGALGLFVAFPRQSLLLGRQILSLTENMRMASN